MQHPISSITDLAELKEIGTATLEKGNFNEAEQVADRLFELKSYLEAILIYQKIIELNPEEDYHIDGLGNNEEQIGHYEWDAAGWYKEQKSSKKIKGSPYDGLSLCSFANSKYEAGIVWYRDMVTKFPKNYQLIFGLANILYNNGIYEQAIHYYEEVSKLKPTFVKPLVDLALLYEYRRIVKRKSTQKAKQILALDNSNQFALFVLARNQNDIDKKIHLLEQAWKLNIKYTRICNEIGICFGGTKKQYQEAIKWYQKCTQINPKYSSCYNNIGVNYQLLKDFKEAKSWYFRGVEADNEYKTAYKNLTDVFDELKYSDEQILLQSKGYQVKQDIFCYYIGLSYYDKKQTPKSIKWIEKAINLNSTEHRFYNSLAISYDELKDYEKAIENYKKCIQINPSYYSAYYNLAIVYKNQDKEDDAIEWYTKSIEVNPRYSYAYNNLGNIYKNRENYVEAIKNYEKAIEFCSTYTLAYINLGVCHLNLEQYKQAALAFENAQQIVNNDNNNLSESNKQFIKPHLEKFENQGYKWRKFGAYSEQITSSLLFIIKEFQNSFEDHHLYPQIEEKHLLSKEFIQLLKIINESNFELGLLKDILHNIKHLSLYNPNFVVLIYDYLLQFFWKKKFVDKLDYEDIELQIKNSIQKQIQSELSSMTWEKEYVEGVTVIEEQLKQYEKDGSEGINLFAEISYFTSYKNLCSQILIINEKAKKQLPSFENFLNNVLEKSHNKIQPTIETKLSSDKKNQFASVLNVVSQIFKSELRDEFKSQITSAISNNLNNLLTINCRSVAFQIYNTCGNQLNNIFLKGRIEENKETQYFTSNFIVGKCQFDNFKDLASAVSAVYDQSKSYGYQIISFKNGLLERGQNYISIVLKNKQFAFELRFELRISKIKNSLLRQLQKIETFTFGSIFESVIQVSKRSRQTFSSILSYIVENMQHAEEQNGKELLALAKNILNKLPTKQIV